MLKVSEVYKKQTRMITERPDGSEFVHFGKKFTTRDVLINEDYIVAVYPHEFVGDKDIQDIEEAFPEGTKFSTFILDGNSFRSSEIIVVGSFDKFCQKLEEA